MDANRHPDPAALRAEFARRRREDGARHRDIAKALDVSEGELIAAHVGAPQGESPLAARRLAPNWSQLVAELEPVGEVMALTRNESCVHEKPGVYSGATGGPQMGLVLGGAIDLRVFYTRWAHGFAVDESTAKGPQHSLQFYDAQGTAIHKIFVRPATDLVAWQALVERHLADDQRTGIAPQPESAAAAERDDAQVNVDAFRAAWSGMRDTHEFFGLLKTHEVTRTQALRLADPQYAQPVDPQAADALLHRAAESGVPIMVFVGNPGMIQIHSGQVKRVAVMGPWLNVLDEGFNLHLRADHIARAWVVKKPTDDGLVTSLELFDAKGQTIAMFFGERKPGQPELPQWRHLVQAVQEGAGEAAACAR